MMFLRESRSGRASSRLSLPAILGLLFVLAAGAGSESSAAPRADKEKSPWDWGFRLRIRQAYIRNPFDLAEDYPDDWNYIRVRSQLWGAWAPNDCWRVHAMLNNEHRHWFKSNRGLENEDFEIDELIFESLYVRGKKLGSTPFGFKAGRQNLFYGEGFICWDGGPLDGSRTAYFNAVLLQGDWERRRLDVHFISNPEKDEYLPIVNDQDRNLIEWDETGAGLYYTDESLGEKRLDVYYFYKNEKDGDGIHPESDIHTVGARATGRSWDAFDFGLEWASQIGDRGSAGRIGYGGYLWGSYDIPGDIVPLEVGLGAMVLSGDDPDTEDYEGWNPVYSRWPKWSELYIYTLINERGIAYWENIAAGWFGLSWNANPRIQIRGKLRWMWALEAPPDPEKPVFGEGKFRGLLSILELKWNYTSCLSGHLLWEALQPGDFYAVGSDVSHFLRWEIYFRY
jgi:hypothetical protein